MLTCRGLLLTSLAAGFALIAYLCTRAGIAEPNSASSPSDATRPLIAGKIADADLREYINRDVDATTAIQSLLNLAGKTGGAVQLPPGKFLIAGSLTIPEGVTLQGSWENTVHLHTTKTNTVLMITGRKGQEDTLGKGTINLNGSSGIRGLTLAYPDQTFPEVVPYPWAIAGDGYSIHIENVTLVNAYQGIRLGMKESSLHYVRNVFGCVFRRGLSIDNSWDVGRIENVHFNAIYWSRSDLPNAPKGGLPNVDQVVANYTRKHLEAFILNKSDWGSLRDTFVYGAKIGYRFPNGKHGGFNGKLNGIGADGCETCLSFESVNPFGCLISDGTFVSHAPLKAEAGFHLDHEAGGEPNILVTRADCDVPLQLQNCSFFGSPRHIAKLEGKGFVSFNQCRFRGWDVKKENRAAIHVVAGKVSVSHCQFLEPGAGLKAVFLGPKVLGAKVIGNMGVSGIQVTNEIGSKADIAFNDR